MNKFFMNNSKICFSMHTLIVTVFLFFWPNIRTQETDIHENNADLHMVATLRHIQYNSTVSDAQEIDLLIKNFKKDRVLPIHDLPRSIIDKFYSVTGQIPYIIWQIMCLLAWYMVLYIIYRKHYMLSNAYKIVLSIIMLSISLPLIVDASYKSYQRAIVREDKVLLYIGPDDRYPVKATLDYLEDVRIIKELISGTTTQNVWYYIQSSQGNGWIPAHAIELVKANQ